MDDRFWFLKNCDLFERLPAEELRSIEQSALSKSFDRGSLVYLPADAGNSLLLLASGRIKIYSITTEGKQALLALIEPGEIFGELAVINDGPRDEFAEAMEKSELILIPGDTVRTLMERDMHVCMQVTRLLGLRRQQVERRLKSLLFRSNRERLIHLLLELVGKYGRRSPDGISLGIKLSHQELASIIGSTRETVTVLLGELQDQGLVKIFRRRVILRAPAKMAAEIDANVPVIPVGSRPVALKAASIP